MPVFTVIAGPNGSGKSTLTRLVGFEGREHLLDPDAVARDINHADPSAAAIEAGRQVSMRIREYRRYARSLANLPEAMRLADTAAIHDNSGDEHRATLVAKAGVVVWQSTPLRRWAEFLSILDQNK